MLVLIPAVCLAVCVLVLLALRLPGSSLKVDDTTLKATPASAAAVKIPAIALKAERVVVTNGCSFVGRHVVEALLRCEGVREVVVFDKTKTFDNTSVKYLQQSLLRKEEIMGALEGVPLVFHCPAVHEVDAAECQALTIEGTANLLEACATMGVQRLVLVSDALVTFNGDALSGADESTPLATTFADARLAWLAQAETMVLEAAKSGSGLCTCSIRSNGVFGPREPHFIQRVASQAQSKQPFTVLGSGSNSVDFTYVGNTVYGVLLAAAGLATTGASAEKLSGQAVFVTNGAPMPYWDFVAKLLAGLKYNASFTCRGVALRLAVGSVVYPILRALGAAPWLNPLHIKRHSRNIYFSNDKAKALLGYKPLWSIDQGLTLTLRSFRRLRNPDADGNAASDIDESQLPQYTAEEVARHTNDDDAWLIIDGKVYDVSDYVLTHPGGDAIMNNVGQDVSAGFHGPQHPKSVHDTVKAFLIGTLKK